jgi:tRNA-splicing ligase RtcB
MDFADSGTRPPSLITRAANVMGLFEGQVCVMIHCGSRGLGHQVCTDYVATMDRLMGPLRIEVPDRQLARAPLTNEAACRYVGALRVQGRG